MNNKKSATVSQKLSDAIVTIGQINAVSKVCNDCILTSNEMNSYEIANIGEVLALISKLSSEVFDTLVSVEDTIE